MDNGTVWGHGAYLGPDFSAQHLHLPALDLADRIARQGFARPYAELSAEDQAAVEAVTAARFKENRYDPSSEKLTLLPGGAEFFDQAVAYWTRYFIDPGGNGGLGAKAIADPLELRALTAFFAWTAWASVADRPGSSHSYTNNFPVDAGEPARQSETQHLSPPASATEMVGNDRRAIRAPRHREVGMR
jgi:nitric oxide reductase subunit B